MPQVLPAAIHVLPLRGTLLRQQFCHDLAAHVGEAEVAALESERELLVIDAEAMQERGVKIVNVDRVLDNVVTEVVRLAERNAAFDTAARHPDAETTRM